VEKIRVNIRRKEGCKDLPLPRYMSEGASGVDLYAAVETELMLEPQQIRAIPSGVFVEVPTGYEAQVRARSGLALKNGLQALKTDSAYLESALEKLKEKAAGLEKDLGPGLEELREKMASLEKLERRAVRELGAGLEKTFQEKFKDMLAQLRTVREKLDAVTEDYKLVIDKRLLTLETKYSAFETFSKRLDSIAKELKR